MLKDSEKLNAIAWKARKIGISYGMLSATLTKDEEAKIYDEYEKYWQTPRTSKRKKSTPTASS